MGAKWSLCPWRQQSLKTKAKGSGSADLGSRAALSTHQLCGIGQVTYALGASVSSFVKWG